MSIKNKKITCNNNIDMENEIIKNLSKEKRDLEIVIRNIKSKQKTRNQKMYQKRKARLGVPVCNTKVSCEVCKKTIKTTSLVKHQASKKHKDNVIEAEKQIIDNLTKAAEEQAQ